jgi:hypothetical protein
MEYKNTNAQFSKTRLINFKFYNFKMIEAMR